VCIAAPRSRPLIDLFKDLVDFQSGPSQPRCRVLHTFSSTISAWEGAGEGVGMEAGAVEGDGGEVKGGG